MGRAAHAERGTPRPWLTSRGPRLDVVAEQAQEGQLNGGLARAPAGSEARGERRGRVRGQQTERGHGHGRTASTLQAEGEMVQMEVGGDQLGLLFCEALVQDGLAKLSEPRRAGWRGAHVLRKGEQHRLVAKGLERPLALEGGGAKGPAKDGGETAAVHGVRQVTRLALDPEHPPAESRSVLRPVSNEQLAAPVAGRRGGHRANDRERRQQARRHALQLPH